VRELELGKLARIPKIGDILALNLKQQVGDVRQRKRPESEGTAEATKIEARVEKEPKSQAGQRKLIDF
jgi:hypothetical protein